MHVHSSIAIAPDDEIEAHHRNGHDWISVNDAVDRGFDLHLGDTDIDLIGNADRLVAALQECRKAALFRLAADEATVILFERVGLPSSSEATPQLAQYQAEGR